MHSYMYVCMFVYIRICVYKDMYVCMCTINQTNRYILYLLNTDDINYTIKTLSLCMYACDDSIQLRYVYDST